ncbi:MAG TPA: glycosyltransferase family 2 protein [Polyangiaceae bacterium]|nr:glycosyltransferase family 2 protein [Polyangiaceae bacterium]
MSVPTSIRCAIKRVTTDEVNGVVVRDGSSEPVEIEVRANGQPCALGRAEQVLQAGRLAYRVRVALTPGDLVEVHPAGGAVGRRSHPRIVPPAGPLPRFGIGAIFRNEAPYVTEWVAHHRLMGFRDIFIADNDSDDGTWELLQAIEQLGYLKCFRFPNPPGQRPQLPAYAEVMHRFGSEVDWMAFIDADEFVWPTNGERTAIPSLAGLAARPEIGAIVLNWAIHGSSWHANHAAGLVTERFQRGSPRSLGINHHYKTVLRSAAWSGAFKNPHLARLDAHWQVTHVNGAPLVPHRRHGAGLSADVVWDVLRLNHYAVKSRQEFDERKRPKGRVSHPGERSETYFIIHDRNDTPSPVPEWSRSLLAAEVARMEAELLSAGHAPPERPTAAAVLVAPFEGAQGSLDDVRLDEGQLVLSGWALESTGAAPERLAVEFGELRFESGSFRRLARMDVKRKYPMCTLECGYEWRIPTSALVSPFERPPKLRLYAELHDGGWSAPLSHRAVRFGPSVTEPPKRESLPLDATSATAVGFQTEG